MATNRPEQFAAALQDLERGGDLETFIAVFADDAELHRPETGQHLSGTSGAHDFWQQYLATFEEVRTEFSRIVDAEVGVLEWTSSGQLPNGAPISYTGVSLVDFDDAGQVTRFATYFDTQAFTRPHPAS